jgi:hemoglobin
MSNSLYQRLGGQAAVDAAVTIFYRKVLQDEQINYFFDNIDMQKQIVKQKSFLTMAFGGPNHYTGEQMRKGHAHLVRKGLNDDHFNVVANHLQATLTELNVASELIDEVMVIVESVRNDVLGQ